MQVLYLGRGGIWKWWFLWREEDRRTRRKTLGARRELINNKIKPHMATGRNRTQTTLLGGKLSHHFASPAPQKIRRLDSQDYIDYPVSGHKYKRNKENITNLKST